MGEPEQARPQVQQTSHPAGDGSQELVRYEEQDQIAIITLNRPEKYNALSTALLEQMAKAFDRAEASEQVRVVVLAGGPKHFCVGADINEFTQAEGVAGGAAWVERVRPSFERVAACRKPVVAAIQGFALGGGCELVMQADLRVAGESAQLGQPEILLGILPGAGGTQRLPRLIGATRAKELLFLGDRVGAAEAQRLGLVNRVVPDDKVLEEALALAKRLAQQPPIALRLIKQCVDQGLQMPLAAALEMERQAFALTFGTEDKQEGVRAFLEKRRPAFTGR